MHFLGTTSTATTSPLSKTHLNKSTSHLIKIKTNLDQNFHKINYDAIDVRKINIEKTNFMRKNKTKSSHNLSNYWSSSVNISSSRNNVSMEKNYGSKSNLLEPKRKNPEKLNKSQPNSGKFSK